MKKMLVVMLMAVVSSGAIADLISAQNVSTISIPDETQISGIGFVGGNRWEGQQVLVTLPYVTAIDWAVLTETHPWNNLSANAVVETRVYATDGGMPSTLLGSAQMTRPLSVGGTPARDFTYKFEFATPIDVSDYVGTNSPIAITWGVVGSGTGEYSTLSSLFEYYTDGMGLVSYDGGSSWYLDGQVDRMFHVYGTVPEPTTITLLGAAGLALLRSRKK